jgi:glycosyltransferase involved in cell wall biosynthesis
MVKISFFGLGPQQPCWRFRVKQYLERVNDEFDYAVDYLLPDACKGNDIPPSRKVLHAIRRAKCMYGALHRGDRIVIQKMLLFRNNVMLEKLAFRYAKNGVVIDFDDNIFHHNPRFSYSVAHADLVIAGNTFLADWASGLTDKIKVIPTTIDVERFTVHNRPQESAPIVGWTATKSNLHNLEVVVPVLRSLQSKYDFSVLLIMDLDVIPTCVQDLRVNLVRWSEQREIEQLTKMDIGIMPLQDNVLSKGKCGFKLLEYMASGILAVGSAVGANNDIIEDGADGFLCHSADEWYSKLEWAVLNYGSSRFNQMLANARRKVTENYSTQVWYSHFVDALMHLR